MKVLNMVHTLEDLQVYQAALALSDLAWEIYKDLPIKMRDISSQFIKASDSIGANIAEGYGRGSYKDRKHFMNIARGSLTETEFWLKLLLKRNLITADKSRSMQNQIKLVSILIMGYIKYLNAQINPSP
jgi:four helix bundle protein